ncbi:MAG: hypothetical protein KAI47_14935, partial [Deltaproteobacteria bacterium]|nr:hypothetical protein [Deltaproteobacteria bacterium]
MFQLLTRLRPFRGGTIPFGLLGALSFMACGARSAHVPPTRDAAPIVRRDLSSVVDIAPSKDSPSRPDGPPPIDAPRPPASWQDLPIHSLGHIEIHDIRGLSDDEVWLAGQGSTAGSAEVWALDGHVFRPVGGPKTPYPLQSIWAQ